MKVENVMVKKVKSVSPEMPVAQALDALAQNKISGLPVIDKENRLVGMFTEKELLSYILPGYLKKVGNFIYRDNPKMIGNKVKELMQDKKVSDIMREEIVTVGPDAPLSEVARKMMISKIRRMPVVDAEGRVIGIVAREDVIKAFMRGEV